MTKPKTVGSEELTRNVKATLDAARERPVVVTKWGTPHSVILSYSDWKERTKGEPADTNRRT